jgi:hypothetical protein
MTHPILSRIPFLGRLVDERFLEHRRRSSSAAGFSALLVSIGLFEYRYFANRIWSWDLFAVVLTFAAVKMSLFLRYRFTD